MTQGAAIVPSALGALCCGWRHGGQPGQELVLTGDLVDQASDWSAGHGLHWTSSGLYQAAILQGVSIPASGKVTQPYATNLRLIATRFRSGVATEHPGNVYVAARTMRIGGPFWLAAVLGNTRPTGVSSLWGQSEESRVVLDHGTNALYLVIGGDRKLIAPKGSMPGGFFLLEVGRGSRQRIRVLVNGRDVSTPGMKAAGVLELGGFGWAGASGEYAFRDYLGETVELARPPNLSQGRPLEQYLANRWGLALAS